MGNLKEARKHMDEALKISYHLNESDRQTIQSEFAEILYQENKIDSALILIRPLPSSVDLTTLPYCLGVAAAIYKEAGILDTAYMYARQLTQLSAPDNKTSGYRIIFSDELKQFFPKDTIQKLMPEYQNAVDDYLDTHQAEYALIQNTRYNYSIHSKQRQKTENELRTIKERIWMVEGSLILMLLVVTTIMLWRKYDKSKKDSQVMEGIILADRLKENTEQSAQDVDYTTHQNSETTLSYNEKKKILDQIRREREEKSAQAVDELLYVSPLFKELKEKADNKKVIGKDVTWRMIEDLIELVSPGFDSRLTILAEGRITRAERNLALFMKCGFTQAQMASLFAKSDSTISAQRKSLASKIGYDKSVIAPLIVRL